MLQTLAENGMNVARLNMGHGTHEWHKDVIDKIRKLNRDNGQVLFSLDLLSTCTVVGSLRICNSFFHIFVVRH